MRKGDIKRAPATEIELDDDTMTDEGTFALSHDRETHDDLMSIRGSGIMGLLESIPLTVKLIAFCCLAILGVTALAIILMVIQGRSLRDANKSKRFISDAYEIGKLISALQDERDEITLFMASENYTTQTTEEYGKLIPLYRETDKWMQSITDRLQQYIGRGNWIENNGTTEIVGRSLLDIKSDKYNETVAAFRAVRESLERKEIVNQIYYFSYYRGLISVLLDILTLFTQDSATSISFSYVNFMGVYESQQQLRNQARSMLTTRFITADGSRDISNSMIAKNSKLDQWINTAMPELSNLYNGGLDPKAIESINNVLVELSMVRSSYRGVTVSPAYTLQLWVNNTDSVNSNLKNVRRAIMDKLSQETNARTRRATSLIAVGLVIVAICIAVTLPGSIMLSFTIIGPWRRLNTVLGTSISLFLPQRLLKWMGFNRITDITLGKSKTKELTFVDISIRDFYGVSSNMAIPEMINYANTILGICGNIIRDNNGVISRYSEDKFSAIFQTNDSALKSAAAIGLALEEENQKRTEKKSAPITTTSSIHKANAVMTMIGDEKRMEPAILTPQKSVMEVLGKISNHFGLSSLVTTSGMNRCKRSTIKMLQKRYIGKVKKDAMSPPEEVWEIFNLDVLADKKRASTAKFEEAVRLMEGGYYRRSMSAMEQVVKECSEDRLAQEYALLAKKQCKRYSDAIGNLTVHNVLGDEELMKGFENYCRKEHSSENIELWKMMKEFEVTASAAARRSLLENMYETFISQDAKRTINVNQPVRTQIKNMLDQVGDIPTTALEQLNSEMLLLMGDTCRRFKVEETTAQSFMKSSYWTYAFYINELQ